MVGLGAANLAAGLFQGFPISSSSSRTPVAEAAGSKTQLTGVFGAVAVALLVLLAPTLLQDLPNSALAAVVIASAIGLFEFNDLRRIFRIQRWEFWLSIACFVGVAMFGAIPGIGLAILIAVLEFLWDGWRPHYAVLGRVSGVRGYHDIKRYPEARIVPGLVLFRWDAPLFFANAELFHQRLLEAVAQSPTPVKRIIVTAEPVTSIDVTSADMLAELEQSLRESGIEIRFAEMKDPVKDKLKRFELLERFGAANFHPDYRRCSRRLPRRAFGGLETLKAAAPGEIAFRRPVPPERFRATTLLAWTHSRTSSPRCLPWPNLRLIEARWRPRQTGCAGCRIFPLLADANARDEKTAPYTDVAESRRMKALQAISSTRTP
jgi:MFS superfamily sulfate permease-like transporter